MQIKEGAAAIGGGVTQKLGSMIDLVRVIEDWEAVDVTEPNRLIG